MSTGRVLAVVASFALGVGVACGGSDDATNGSSSGKSDGGTSPGNGATPGSKGRSCTGGIGADKKCGGVDGNDTADGAVDCCAVQKVPGGSYNRFNDPKYPAKVDAFSLDTFELTAGRFRAWVDATDGDLRAAAPSEGQGAHPKIAKSGWRTEWNKFLPRSRDEVDIMLGPEDSAGSIMACQFGTDLDSEGALTWWTSDIEAAVKKRNAGKTEVLKENTKEALDRKPLNCIPWHVLFAFCVWDGGRLPTNAEWGYAASGGSEQRPFPWGDVDDQDLAHIDNRSDLSSVPVFGFGKKYVAARLYDKSKGDNHFEDNYSFTWGNPTTGKSDNASHVMPVGRRPAGNGKWGHADLAGGMFEWMLDEGPIKQGDCDNCANVNWPLNDAKDPASASLGADFTGKTAAGVSWDTGGVRAIRGSAWDNAQGLAVHQVESEIEFFTAYPVLRTYRAIGGRCARDL